MSDPSILTAALYSAVFAELLPRLAFFPLRPIVQTPTGPGCTCVNGSACPSIGKHPGVLWKDLTTAEKRVSDVDGVGYGIATGARSGVIVVDLDGLDAIRAFYAMGPVPRTFTVRRGHDRGHLYFRGPSSRVRNSASELAPKIDIRGDGGFVVAPGSPHKSGMTYLIADDVPVVDAPAWLLSWPGLRQSKARVHESTPTEVTEIEARIGSLVPRAWRVERARAWLAAQPAAITGQSGHNVTMRTLAIAARENLLTSEDMILEAISEWNSRCEPTWRGSELSHKVSEVLRRSTIPWNESLAMHYALAARSVA